MTMRSWSCASTPSVRRRFAPSTPASKSHEAERLDLRLGRSGRAGGVLCLSVVFNPNRMVKARLGEIAAAISVSPGETELGRVARLAQLRKLVTDDVRISIGRSGPDLKSRDAVMAAVAAFAPPPGWNVDFVNADVAVNDDGTARAFVTADVTSRDAQTGKQ